MQTNDNAENSVFGMNFRGGSIPILLLQSSVPYKTEFFVGVQTQFIPRVSAHSQRRVTIGAFHKLLLN